MYSYPVRLITEWFNKNSITDYKCVSRNNIFDLSKSAILLQLPNHLALSIQTNPQITSGNFAETALLKNDRLIFIEKLGYSDTIKHYDPEDLYHHITALISACKNLDIDLEQNTT